MVLHETIDVRNASRPGASVVRRPGRLAPLRSLSGSGATCFLASESITQINYNMNLGRVCGAGIAIAGMAIAIARSGPPACVAF